MYLCPNPTLYAGANTIYNKDGTVSGIVADIKNNHKFDDGTTGLVLRICFQNDESVGNWMHREMVTQGRYVKETVKLRMELLEMRKRFINHV
ncbi:MAG TPA: hypothetical protein VGB77_09995 [Abditibacteriaceae bacterium]